MRSLLVACLAASLVSLWGGPATPAAQRKSPPKTEAEGQLKALREWNLRSSERALAADSVFPEWIGAVERHTPGAVDDAAIQIGQWPGERLDLLVKWIYQQLHTREEVRQAFGLTPKVRLAELARRGAVLHADVALRAGWRQTSLRISPFTYSVVETEDGRDVGLTQPDVHLEVGRALLTVLADAGVADREFDSLWYAATAAPLLRAQKIGYAEPHVVAGLDALPDDPRLLFYRGALHEALAAPRAQRVIEVARLPSRRHWDIGSSRQELHRAEELLIRALRSAPANAEIHLHHARVIGLLGQHASAATELAAFDGKLEDRELAYYTALFRAEEDAALGREEAARDAFERAATLFPDAQSPLMGLSRLARAHGDRPRAVAALRRLFALPSIEDGRRDPWWDYYESHVRDADALMNELYASVTRAAR